MADRELSLTGHLVELRRRLVISAAALVAGTGVAFAFHRIIFDLLMVPAQGFASLQGQKLIFTQVTEMIGITMKVSLMGGLVLAFPVILFQVVMFVAPGLTSREKRYLYALFPGPFFPLWRARPSGTTLSCHRPSTSFWSSGRT